MQTHRLKTWPEFYEQVRLGQKSFEVRRDDRGFESGDFVVLEEWNPESKQYTGEQLEFQIGAVVRASWVGLQDGFCAFSLLPVRDVEQRVRADGEGGAYCDCKKPKLRYVPTLVCFECERPPRPPLPGDGAGETDGPAPDEFPVQGCCCSSCEEARHRNARP